MEIDREKEQGDFEDAKERVTFCLDKLEGADCFKGRIDMDTEIVPGLMLEEIIGALVSSEQEMAKL